MSWTTETREFPMSDIAELNKSIKSLAEQEREQYGYEPSGYWGSRDDLNLQVHDKVFSDAGSAAMYLNDVIDRHGPLVAVKFYDMSISEKETTLRQKISAIEITISKQNVTIAKIIRKTAKTSYNGGQCPHCKNNWCTEFLATDKCKLCHIPYWSAENKAKRIKNLGKQSDLLKQLKAETMTPVKTGTLKWMVSGSAPA